MSELLLRRRCSPIRFAVPKNLGTSYGVRPELFRGRSGPERFSAMVGLR